MTCMHFFKHCRKLIACLEKQKDCSIVLIKMRVLHNKFVSENKPFLHEQDSDYGHAYYTVYSTLPLSNQE